MKEENKEKNREVPDEKPDVAEQDEVPAAEAEVNPEIESLKEENAKLQKTVARLQSSADKSDMYLTQLVAMKNDFENYKRRMRLNTEQAKDEGVRSVAIKLIDIADTFDIAEKHISDEDTLKAFGMVRQKFTDVLQSVGVEKIDVLGEPFDHKTMNAISQMDRGEENSGKVVEVYKNGYRMGEKIIRYAEVIVGA